MTTTTWRAADDIDHLILNDPAEYERLLHSFHLLLGHRKAWWERDAMADHPEWRTCVRRAITQVAKGTGIAAPDLAEYLDAADLPKTRAMVLRIARERLEGVA